MGKGRRASDRRKEREAQAPETIRGRVGEPPDEIDVSADTAFLSQEKPRSRFSAPKSEDDKREATQITTIKKTPPRGGCLYVVSGPFAGSDAVIEHTPCVVGREEASGIAIDEETISRAHFELRFNEKRGDWSICDLQSSSGTLKNGAPITSDLEPIVFGDILHAGESVFRFMWHTQLPEPDTPKKKREREEKASQKKRLLPYIEKRTWISLAAVALILAMLGGAFWAYKAYNDAQKARLTKASVAQILGEAKTRLEARDIDGALAQVNAAKELDENDPDLQSLAKAVASEKDAQEALKNAEAALAQNDHKKAKAALATIADSSAFQKERDALYKRANTLARAEGRAEIRNLIRKRSFDEAQQALDYHASRFPNDAGLEALRAELAQKRGTAAPDSKPVARAKKAFRAGDYGGAKRAIAAGGSNKDANAYSASLQRYLKAREKGQGLVRQKSARAKGHLDVAWKLASVLGGGKGQSTLSSSYGKALYLSAISAKQKGNKCAWAKDILRASQVAPGDKNVIVQKKLVSQAAESALLRARAFEGAKRQSAARAGLCFAAPGTKKYKALKKYSR